jgi:putative hemolysin
MDYINIEKQIKESNSLFLKRLPHFVIRLLAIIIKQDEINRILTKYSDFEGPDFLPKLIGELNIHIEIEGAENLPDNGKCFFVANHPFGFIDGLVLTNTVAEKYGEFKGIGNEMFMMVPHLRPVIAAVNVFGTNPREYLVELEKVFRSDIPITHFPAGVVSRIINGKIVDSEWQKSFISKAVSCKRDVVPFYFSGRNSFFFYFVFMFRKIFRIRTNLELALLPHEIFTKKNKTIKVKIGKPISYETFDKSLTHIEWAQYVKDQVYYLKNSKKTIED